MVVSSLKGERAITCLSYIIYTRTPSGRFINFSRDSRMARENNRRETISKNIFGAFIGMISNVCTKKVLQCTRMYEKERKRASERMSTFLSAGRSAGKRVTVNGNRILTINLHYNGHFLSGCEVARGVTSENRGPIALGEQKEV